MSCQCNHIQIYACFQEKFHKEVVHNAVHIISNSTKVGFSARKKDFLTKCPKVDAKLPQEKHVICLTLKTKIRVVI